ncbi:MULTISPECIES: hypothetical protein [Neptunomonas]|uniref:Uncharacterized protein n=1 Tax=Neptunomonas marina TaxID=1815562 RepID=A0A437Q467_9GAMM|nr:MULTISPECIES: hypothetical protein [Neptunomonas]RVU29223.1 hypothetical protein EOE65_17500 [Neptunomonas marina]
MSDELIKYLAVAALVLFAFIPVTYQTIRQRRLNPPPMAKHDRKLFRLWRSDPEAYERQYGEMDRQYLAKKADKEKR